MSGKYEKKGSGSAKKGHKSRNAIKNGVTFVVILAIAVLIMLVVLAVSGKLTLKKPADVPVAATLPTVEATQGKEQAAQMHFDLGEGLQITQVGPYTGIYLEDGTDELVSGVVMAVLENNSDKDVEYAEFTLHGDAGDAFFSVSALPAGTKAVLMEKNRKPFSYDDNYTEAEPGYVAYFQTDLSCMEDILKIQGLDGALNVTNISAGDITGDIVICYKNSAYDYFYGGIAYRVRIEGGLKAGEIRQIMTKHFAGENSTIIYAAITE